MTRRDWPVYQTASSPLDEAAYTLFSQPGATQPMVATHLRQYNHGQLGQADTRTAPLAIRSSGGHRESPLPLLYFGIGAA